MYNQVIHIINDHTQYYNKFCCLDLILTHSHSLSLTLTHSHSVTLTHSHSLSHSHSLTIHSLSLTHSHSLSFTLPCDRAGCNILWCEREFHRDCTTCQHLRPRALTTAACTPPTPQNSSSSTPCQRVGLTTEPFHLPLPQNLPATLMFLRKFENPSTRVSLPILGEEYQ